MPIAIYFHYLGRQTECGRTTKQSRWTDRQVERQVDRQVDRQADRQAADRQTG